MIWVLLLGIFGIWINLETGQTTNTTPSEGVTAPNLSSGPQETSNAEPAPPQEVGMTEIHSVEDSHDEPRRRISGEETGDQTAKRESELEKWKAVEIFKVRVPPWREIVSCSMCGQITLNHMQVLAIAISFDVRWTDALIVMFKAAGNSSSFVYNEVRLFVYDRVSWRNNIRSNCAFNQLFDSGRFFDKKVSSTCCHICLHSGLYFLHFFEFLGWCHD